MDQAGHWHEFLSKSRWLGLKWNSIRNMYIGRKGNHLLGQGLTKKKKDREQLQ
jgi:hypothetical protein